MKKASFFTESSWQVACFLLARTRTVSKIKPCLKLYKGLRVADVCDGMDMVGLMDVGLMDPKIAPLWKDIQNLQTPVYGNCFYCSLCSYDEGASSRRFIRGRI